MKSHTPHPGWLIVALATVIAAVACAPTAPSAPSKEGASAKAMSAEQLAVYKGADRAQIIEQGARSEGSLMVYTSYIVNQVVRPLVDAFQAKYPFVKVEYYRADGPEIEERVRTEYKAGRYEVDIIDDSTTPVSLGSEGITTPYYSPHMEAFPRNADTGAHPEGKWTVTVRYPRGLSFNTKLVNKAEVPTTWEGLLDPKWKGKLAWSDSPSTAQMIIGSWLFEMGEQKGTDFVKQFAKQDVATLNQSTRTVLDQVIAGQYAMCLCSVHHTEFSKAQGAPVDWVSPGEIVPQTTSMLALAKNAKHPHAAMLWIDFMLDPDGGQKVFSQVHYIPSHPKFEAEIPGLKGKKVWVLGEKELKDADKWQKLLNENFRR